MQTRSDQKTINQKSITFAVHSQSAISSMCSLAMVEVEANIWIHADWLH